MTLLGTIRHCQALPICIGIGIGNDILIGNLISIGIGIGNNIGIGIGILIEICIGTVCLKSSDISASVLAEMSELLKHTVLILVLVRLVKFIEMVRLVRLVRLERQVWRTDQRTKK